MSLHDIVFFIAKLETKGIFYRLVLGAAKKPIGERQAG